MPANVSCDIDIGSPLTYSIGIDHDFVIMTNNK